MNEDNTFYKVHFAIHFGVWIVKKLLINNRNFFKNTFKNSV